jgi:hypothetical protein
MKRAETRLKAGGLVLPAGIMLLCGLLLGWREWNHRQQGAAWRERCDTVERQLADTSAGLEQALEGSRKRSALLDEAEIRLQTLVDRAGNLEAQREHLRAENNRLAEKARSAESALEHMQTELETARHELLVAQELPHMLRSELEAARARASGMEELLDARTAATSRLPDEWSLGGLSADLSVFSLAGDARLDREFPFQVHLCNRDGILLDGWIHRREGELLIGHVKQWRTPSSALVKGQKVFILPGTSHEADY